MGPRSIDRGIVETYNGAIGDVHASMGPRSIDRGIDLLNQIITALKEASMGPRSIDRGIGWDYATYWPFDVLQWGRDQLIAESFLASPKRSLPRMLQWGRDQLIAESGRC